ncbi:MAG TPA: MFS transporter [Patescibacteria group bacterium]|jgi:MFS family permease|nr:MFS transporter [Patescibacteria group bacterium]
MTFIEHFHLPHYFTSKVRKEIEHLYGAVAIGNLAQAIIALFEPIFLYHVVGLSVSEVLLFMAAIYAVYALIIPFGGKVAAKFGYAHAIFFSIPFQIIFWFLILGAEKNILLLIGAVLSLAIQKTLYWPALHASLARFSGKKQRGREFSLMYAIMNLMQIIGPMLGGFLSAILGIEAVFVIASIIYFCSAVPVLWSIEIFKPKPYHWHDTLALYKQYPLKFLGYFGFGEELLVLTIWPIFIYIIIANYQDTGTLVTIATLVATGLALYIGFYTDRHSKESLLRAGTLIYALTWLARIPIISPFAVFITDALSRTTKSLVFIPVSAVTYERAEQTHIMPYVIGFEQMLAIGKMLAALIGMVVFIATGSFVALFIVASILSLFYFLI